MFQVPAAEGTGAPPIYHSCVMYNDMWTLTCQNYTVAPNSYM